MHRKRFIKEEIIGSIYDEFIELFSSEAGMVDKESIVKKRGCSNILKGSRISNVFRSVSTY